MIALCAALIAIAPPLAVPLRAQNPLRHPTDALELRVARAAPVVYYTLRVDSADLSGWSVAMRLRNVPDSFRVAMSAHPEYDDKYWRYLTDVQAAGANGAVATIVRTDSALWTVRTSGGEALIRYRLVLPRAEPGPRAAWKPFLAPTGGLLGGPHAFLYVVGATLAPAHVTFDLPGSWTIATGLTPTADSNTFFAPTVDALLEGPALAGQLKSWRFAVDGTPHRVVYWAAPAAPAFDSAAFVRGIRGVVEQAVALFGRAPWREYTFLFQDNARGGLEHANSVTLGASADQLARDPLATLAETAHEFFHAWNLMRIRPAEYRTVDYRVQPPTKGLWFSEGLTIFYADLLRRRAGLPTEESARTAHLATIIERYLAQPGHAKFSAERISEVAYNSAPGALGDYGASAHLMGEVIGAMLDLVIRDATKGTKSVDDVMRLMLDRWSGERGFTGQDIERAVEDVCGCDVTPFFEAHVRGASAIAFDRYLALIGLRARVTQAPAVGRDGAPVVDLRVYASDAPNGGAPTLVISNPETPLGRAGLHTGDRLRVVNGAPVRSWPEFRRVLVTLKIGDTTRVEVERAGRRIAVTVVAAALVRPVVALEEIAGASATARALRAAWLAGK